MSLSQCKSTGKVFLSRGASHISVITVWPISKLASWGPDENSLHSLLSSHSLLTTDDFVQWDVKCYQSFIMFVELFFQAINSPSDWSHHWVDSDVTTTKQSQHYDLLIPLCFFPPGLSAGVRVQGNMAATWSNTAGVENLSNCSVWQFQQCIDTVVFETVYCMSERKHLQNLSGVLAAAHIKEYSCFMTRLQQYIGSTQRLDAT